MNTYLQGRKITAAQDYERPSVEALQLIRKLRWIGMEEEAEQLQMKIQEATPAVSPRPRTRLTRSTVRNSASKTDGHCFLTMVLLAVLLTTGEQRIGL